MYSPALLSLLLLLLASDVDEAESAGARRSMADRAPGDTATMDGLLTGVGLTSEKIALGTCRGKFFFSGSMGTERRARLSKLSVSRVANVDVGADADVGCASEVDMAAAEVAIPDQPKRG